MIEVLSHGSTRISCAVPQRDFIEFDSEEVERSIPERFEKIVRQHPDRIAVKAGKHVVTYAELNAMANRLARAIVAGQGEKAEPVGLLLEKAAPLMAAMLGVLKAGKFFVLLDPAFPKARIAAVLEDSQAKLVVTDRSNASLARQVLNDSGLIEVESIDSRVPNEDLRLQILPKALAYLVYTSGSTGQPKGVVHSHQNLLHNIMLRTNAMPVYMHDRVALLPSGTANAVTHTFFALLNGAVLLPIDVRMNGAARLRLWLLEERVSFLWISSPLFRNLCEIMTGNERFPGLRLLRLTSETVYKTDVDLYKKHFSFKCVFVNGLHSSETGPLRFYFVNHNTAISGDDVPVGYPVADKEILLLDDEGQEVGFNRVGEIVVRSKYLSPGYWNRPDLTGIKFKADPHDTESQLYFTGDLGLMLPDGCLIHKGRKDFRVKVRGYGVEVSEVEVTLLSHPAVSEVAVVPRQNELGESYLVAYFATHSQPGPSISELRGLLKNKLADYMVPSYFVQLDTIPLTSSGKVDRKALPVPGGPRPQLVPTAGTAVRRSFSFSVPKALPVHSGLTVLVF
jgi:amino acid adenylation domain-containing protein